MVLNKQSFLTLGLLTLAITPLTHCLRGATTQISTEINASNFDKEVLQSELPVIVKVSATWCPPCQKLKPLFEQVAQTFQGQCTFCSMDYDKNVAFAEKNHIDTIPTFMIYNQGKLLAVKPYSSSGLQALEKFVQEILNRIAQS